METNSNLTLQRGLEGTWYSEDSGGFIVEWGDPYGKVGDSSYELLPDSFRPKMHDQASVSSENPSAPTGKLQVRDRLVEDEVVDDKKE